jgi:Protein of unknown function (DUF3987)
MTDTNYKPSGSPEQPTNVPLDQEDFDEAVLVDDEDKDAEIARLKAQMDHLTDAYQEEMYEQQQRHERERDSLKEKAATYPDAVRAAAVQALPRTKHWTAQNHLINVITNQPLLDTSLPDSGNKVWPKPLGEDAYIGFVRDFVSVVYPHSEADPNALVVILLTAIGNWFGRVPHYNAGDTRHGTNLFTVLVGPSSSGRKGTATDSVRKLLKHTDPKFNKERVHNTGLSTGEGMIYKVRDLREETEAVERGGTVSTQNKVVDFGVDDKRLLAIETEFAQVLQKGKKEGNTLTATMRTLWDGHPVHQGAKTNKDSVQSPHISMIGNITEHELKACLGKADMSNGFANRILWCCSKKSKTLPFARPLPQVELDKLRDALLCVERNMPGEMFWWDGKNPECMDMWAIEYERLSAGKGDGIFEDITARAIPQVIRLTMIYAALDQSSVFKVEHLKAALEVWRYCEDSARYIFGDVVGDKLANQIIDLLTTSPRGMTQTEISDAFKRNKSSAQIQAALRLLEEAGKVDKQVQGTSGRPLTTWRKVKGTFLT